MNRRLVIAAVVALLLAGTAMAQMPPGKWWRQANIVNNLQLSADQQEKLETIFRNSANELIDLKGEVEKANIALRGELDQPQLNRQNVLRAAAKLNDAQGRKFARELAMLVDMRSVLTDAQWNKMRNNMDRVRENQPPRPRGQRMEGQRGMQGRPGMPPRPQDGNRPAPAPVPPPL